MAEVTCETFMTVVMEMPSSFWEGRGLGKAVAGCVDMAWTWVSKVVSLFEDVLDERSWI